MTSARPSQAVVRALHVYPLKSAQGLAPEWVRLTPMGFQWDRHWMAVDSRGSFLSQRTHPRLARIRTSLGGEALELQGPGDGWWPSAFFSEKSLVCRRISLNEHSIFKL